MIILSRRTLLVSAIAGFVISSALLSSFIFRSPITKSGPLLRMETRFGLPVRLQIPAINVDSNVEYVGLTSDGAMDVPKNPDNVGWYMLGPRPGENGNAVIAGHYGIKNGKGSVFDSLYKLRKGDKIYIKNDKGAAISFIVRESRSYDPKAEASDVFGSNDGNSHLNLITCEGVWNKVTKGYPQRLVVFTDRE